MARRRSAIAPVSKDLSRIVGIKKGSSVFFFAGCYGSWAEALARDGIKVTYSDVSANMVQGVKGRAKEVIARYRVFEASQWPRRPEKYDWSVSFEPIPIKSTGLPLALMRSLLNKKGAKLIYSTLFIGDSRIAFNLAKRIAELYGASCRVKRARVRDFRNGQKRGIRIITLKTNERARRKAWVDVQVLKAVRSKRKERGERKLTFEELLQSERIKRLGISEEELVESLNRLEALISSSKLEKHFLAEVKSEK